MIRSESKQEEAVYQTDRGSFFLDNTDQYKQASLFDLIALSLNGPTLQPNLGDAAEITSNQETQSVNARFETLNMQEFLEDAIKKNSLQPGERRKVEDEKYLPKQVSPSAIERQLQRILDDSQNQNVAADESAQFQIEVRQSANPLSDESALNYSEPAEYAMSQRVLNPINLVQESPSRQGKSEFDAKDLEVSDLSPQTDQTPSPDDPYHSEVASPGDLKQRQNTINREALEQQQRELYERIEMSMSPSDDVSQKQQKNTNFINFQNNDVRLKTSTKQRVQSLADFSDNANKTPGVKADKGLKTPIQNTSIAYNTKRVGNQSILLKENDESNRKQRLMSAVKNGNKSVNTTIIISKETPKSNQYDQSSVTNFKQQHKVFTPKERSQSTDTSKRIVRLKSTKNYNRMGSDSSINIEEIRQKVSHVQKLTEAQKNQTPKGNYVEADDKHRVFYNGPTTETTQNDEKKVITAKKRGHFSNLRGSKQILASQPKINLVKPLFQNDKEMVPAKPRKVTESQTFEMIDKQQKTGIQSQQVQYPNESELSSYSMTVSQKINYQSPNAGYGRDKNGFNNSKQKELGNSKYELNSNSSASNSMRDLHIKPKAIPARLSKQPTKRQLMGRAINEINIGVIQEFTRIKKPQKQAQLIGKLYCILLCTFRNPMLSPDFSFSLVQQEFDKWDSIQYFIFSNPNRTLNETVLIKQRAKDKTLTNQVYAQNMIVMVAENENHLKNIPNKNLKLIFDMIQRILMYVEYKQFKKSSRKNSGNQPNKDLQIVEDLSSNQQTVRQTEEDEEIQNMINGEVFEQEDEAPQQPLGQEVFRHSEVSQSSINNSSPGRMLGLRSETNHSPMITPAIDYSSHIESQDSCRVETTQIAEVMLNDRYQTQMKIPLSQNSSNQKFEKLRKNYSPAQLRQSPGTVTYKHKFNPSPSKQITLNQRKPPNDDHQEIFAIQQSSHYNLTEQEETPVFAELEIKVDLNSEAQSSSQFEQKSFMEKKASDIIQEMLNIKDQYTLSNNYENQTKQHQEETVFQACDQSRETTMHMLTKRDVSQQVFVMHTDARQNMEEEVKANIHTTSQSQANSRKNSIKVMKPQTQYTSDSSDQSPQSARTSKTAKVTKNYSPIKTSVKKKKELSPTQKLIKFKNKTHKSKVKQQASPQQSSGFKIEQPVLMRPPRIEKVEDYIPKKIAAKGINQVEAKHERQQTPQSVQTSQKTLDDFHYQIQVLNKDIFSYEENNSNTDNTARENSLNSSHQPCNSRINVYQNQIQEAIYQPDITLNDIDDDDGGFQLKLMKVQESSSQDTTVIDQYQSRYQKRGDSRRGVDMNTIEELKMRRLNQMKNQDIHNQNLSERRDDIIKKIQQEIMNNMKK